VITFPVEKASHADIIERCELVFLALPHKASMGFAKELIDKGIKVVDFSADYRLDLETYEANYCPHEDKEHLDDAIYGLIEYYREDLKKFY
ncbi:MAG TPA: N-acetyl-gamma-glutamyl-phosphate reductase, partial [Campylobacterales bacterium]|nr:N-acetyl-gamma-glutamyl-phosphate reductase [Campylobacterales bacterium]